VLQSLVDKSLVRPLRRERFDMLGAVQAYAAEQLVAEGRFPGSGEGARQAAYERHCEWFAALGPKRAVEDACTDLANLVAACRRAIADSQWQLAVDALQGAWAALRVHGPFGIGIELAGAVCGSVELGDGAAACAHAVLGSALDSLGRRIEARHQYELALTCARACGDRACQANVLAGLAALDRREGRMSEARAGHAEALVLARQLNDAATECAALNGIATVDFDQGRLDDARASYESALTRARDAADLGWQCGSLANLGMLYANVGRMDEAGRCFEQSLALARQLGDRQREGNNLCNLGMLHLVQHRLDEAIEALEQALAVARELGHRRLEGIVQCNLGLTQEQRGRAHEALSSFEAALRVMRELGDRRSEGQFLGYLGRTHARLREFDLARECFAAGQTLLRGVADTLSLGILLCDLADCEWHAGEAALASYALSEARSIADAAGAGPQSELGQALARVGALLRGRPAETATTR